MKIHSRLEDFITRFEYSTFDPGEIEADSGRFFSVDRADAETLGIFVRQGDVMPRIMVTDASKPVGVVNIQARFENNTVFFDNDESNGQFFAHINIHGEDTCCIFNEAGKNYFSIEILNLRSHRQNVFVGKDASAVGVSIEMEGEDSVCVIGEDALISSGVWLRNHDMHSLIDLSSGQITNPPPGDILIERHVWLGQDVLAVGGQHIGFGSIIGARSFLKREIPPKSVAVGSPAKVVKSNVSWGRQSSSVSAAELDLISALSSQ
ncbi:acyltransferase [Sphingomonas panacis]|uniref:acyltransferase n=1 Tax=Sphingomonas panacis TaxID=1560345 RepID=UPI00123770DB|nr:hypothetical protein [Sphingomonas panacis]